MPRKPCSSPASPTPSQPLHLRRSRLPPRVQEIRCNRDLEIGPSLARRGGTDNSKKHVAHPRLRDAPVLVNLRFHNCLVGRRRIRLAVSRPLSDNCWASRARRRAYFEISVLLWQLHSDRHPLPRLLPRPPPRAQDAPPRRAGRKFGYRLGMWQRGCGWRFDCQCDRCDTMLFSRFGGLWYDAVWTCWFFCASVVLSASVRCARTRFCRFCTMALWMRWTCGRRCVGVLFVPRWCDAAADITPSFGAHDASGVLACLTNGAAHAALGLDPDKPLRAYGADLCEARSSGRRVRCIWPRPQRLPHDLCGPHRPPWPRLIDLARGADAGCVRSSAGEEVGEEVCRWRRGKTLWVRLLIPVQLDEGLAGWCGGCQASFLLAPIPSTLAPPTFVSRLVDPRTRASERLLAETAAIGCESGGPIGLACGVGGARMHPSAHLDDEEDVSAAGRAGSAEGRGGAFVCGGALLYAGGGGIGGGRHVSAAEYVVLEEQDAARSWRIGGWWCWVRYCGIAGSCVHKRRHAAQNPSALLLLQFSPHFLRGHGDGRIAVHGTPDQQIALGTRTRYAVRGGGAR
ncbi:hypothetical protein B0H16DRAFT_1695090, partial [Mycena metata]